MERDRLKRNSRFDLASRVTTLVYIVPQTVRVTNQSLYESWSIWKLLPRLPKLIVIKTDVTYPSALTPGHIPSLKLTLKVLLDSASSSSCVVCAFVMADLPSGRVFPNPLKSNVFGKSLKSLDIRGLSRKCTSTQGVATFSNARLPTKVFEFHSGCMYFSVTFFTELDLLDNVVTKAWK